jgi:predicted nucleic acid-binding protein
MSHYADSSFLVSCYLLDANTKTARAYLSRTSAPLPWTALHALEVRNAFDLGVFRGLLTAADVAAAWANLESDLRSARLVRATVKWPSVFRRAARLSERHSATTGTRSLDILHVAAAKSVRAVEFITKVNLRSMTRLLKTIRSAAG